MRLLLLAAVLWSLVSIARAARRDAELRALTRARLGIA
jgi:hypothetical protein